MSTTELNRSTLESKDKEQLVTVAKAMGGNPKSRSRKAELVDMILEMAGVDDNGDPLGKPAPAEADAPAESDPTEQSADTQADASSDDGQGGDAAEASDTKARSDQPRGDRQRGDQQRGDRPTRDRGRSNNDDSAGDRDRSDRDSGDRGRNDRDGEDRAKNAGNDDDADNGTDGNAEGDQGSVDRKADVEPGNRRRRRRGRGRDKDRDEEWHGDPAAAEGFLDLREEGYAFLRVQDGRPSKQDVYVPVKLVRQFNLRRGDHVTGLSRPAARAEKNAALMQVDTVNGGPAGALTNRPDFDDLLAVVPTEPLLMERAGDDANVAGRAIDILAPLAKGARALIVAPPRSGKSSIIREIVASIEANNPEVRLLVLLVDERPEEITAMDRFVNNATVVSSPFDRPTEEHLAVSELLLDRAKRQVELGEDVVIVVDGIGRLTHAYNQEDTDNVVSDGVRPAALYAAKRFFGAGRNLEDGGSLTIIGTVASETGNNNDEVILGDLLGTETTELRLDRLAAERRIWPALDIVRTSTMREEDLLGDRTASVAAVRAHLGAATTADEPHGGLQALLEGLGSSASVDAYLTAAAKQAKKK